MARRLRWLIHQIVALHNRLDEEQQMALDAKQVIADLRAQISQEGDEITQLTTLNAAYATRAHELAQQLAQAQANAVSQEDLQALVDLTAAAKTSSDQIAASIKATSASGQVNV